MMRRELIAGNAMILYESECAVCNGVKKVGKEDLKDGKGVYVGESSRSIYE